MTMVKANEDDLSCSQDSSFLAGCDIGLVTDQDGFLISSIGLLEDSPSKDSEKQNTSAINKNKVPSKDDEGKLSNSWENKDMDCKWDIANPFSNTRISRNAFTVTAAKDIGYRAKMLSPQKRLARRTSPPTLVEVTNNRNQRNKSPGLLPNEIASKANAQHQDDVAKNKSSDEVERAEREKYGMLSRVGGKLVQNKERSGYTTCTSHTDFSLVGSLYNESDDSDEDEEKSISVSIASSDTLERHNNYDYVDIEAFDKTRSKYDPLDEKEVADADADAAQSSTEKRGWSDVAGDSFELPHLYNRLRSRKSNKNTKYCTVLLICCLFTASAVTTLVIVVIKTFFVPSSEQGISSQEETIALGASSEPTIQDWEAGSLTTSMFRGGASIHTGLEMKQGDEEHLSKKREIISNKLLTAVEDLALLLDESTIQYGAITWLADESTSLTLSDDELVQRFSARVTYLAFFGYDKDGLPVQKRLLNENEHECYWKLQKSTDNEVDRDISSTDVSTAQLFECNEQLIITAALLSETTAPSDIIPYEMINLTGLSTLKLTKATSVVDNTDIVSKVDVTYKNGESHARQEALGDSVFVTLANIHGLTHLTLDLASVKSLKGISKLSNLKHLQLIGGSNALPTELADMTDLESLVIQNFDHMDPEGFALFPSTLLKRMSSLKTLRIEHCSINWDALDDIEHLTSLEELVIVDCPGAGGTIPSAIGMLHNLIHLDLSSNKLESNIPLSILKLNKLQVLNLSHNLLEDEIPVQIEGLESLVVLDLSYNRFVDPVPQEALDGLFHLESLSLEGNLFVSKEITTATTTAVDENLTKREVEQKSAAKARARHRESILLD